MFTRRRSARLFLLVTLAVGWLTASGPRVASAQTRPPVDWSFYVQSTSTSQAETLGCNQGTYDTQNGNKYSEVILDFGAQNSTGTGTTLVPGANIPVTNAQIEAYAERFAYGYWHCTGNNTTSVLRLGIGTNNSVFGRSTSSLGQNWATRVNNVRSWNSTHGNPTTGACCVSAQVITYGANDIEATDPANPTTRWDTALNTRQWASGFDAATTAFYLNYGDAGGCPDTTWGGGACNGSWTQYDIWQVSWGQSAALPVPEIYVYPSNAIQARQWHMISAYGVRIQLRSKMNFEGPLDQNDIDGSTNSTATARTQLTNEINSTSDTASLVKYSMQLHYTSR